MSATRKIAYLLGAMLAIVLLPYLGAWFDHRGNFPDGYFAYPPLSAPAKPPFSWPVFILFALTSAVVVALYLFPALFGFEKVPTRPQPVAKVRLPVWFWVGLLAWGSAVWLLWTKATRPEWFLHWSDLPLFWGFTLMIDGWVYVRQGGKSLISHAPQEIVGIGVASVTGWMLFEYLNFFVDDNWFYPKGNIIDREVFLLYAIIISSGLLPLAFVWYSWFKTVPALRNRFSRGPRFTLPEWAKTGFLILSLFGLFAAGRFPNSLFFTLWLSPAVLLAAVLDKLGVWTPLRPIGQGNWTPLVLSALAYLVEGFCLEAQNYFSGTHGPDGRLLFTEAPAYWQYSLPYVNRFHIFEMPILGFSGYLPFGVYCWLWWIAFATLQGIPSRYFRETPFDPGHPD